MDMKPVQYFNPQTVENNVSLLYTETYKNVRIVVLNLGKHPTAYVTNFVHLDSCRNSWDWEVYPHGGVTYLGEAYWNPNDKDEYMGWDYGHSGDYDGYHAGEIQIDVWGGPCKQWTTEEIVEDARRFVDYLLTEPLF